MTSKDKTGDKLIASMRKSKTGTVTQKTSERSASAGKTAKKKAAPKAASKPAPIAKVKKKAAPAVESGSGFSHGRRVWPD
jgi:septal ring-binding cell division protein DamX